MQIGEPLSAGSTSLPPDQELAAELVSVTFKSPVKVSRAKRAIEGPHWERGKESELPDDFAVTAVLWRLPVEPYARRAAVYLVAGAGGRHDVEVKVRVTKNQNVNGQARLIGAFSGLEIEGDCPTGPGEHTIAARIANPPEGIQVYRGKIGWALSLDDLGITLSLGATLAEVYFVLSEPREPFARGGVWVEALRFIYSRMAATGETDAHAVTGKITSYCHSRHGLRYETAHGGARYGAGSHGGRFKLTAYMALSRDRCNCYDQAAAIQTFAAALGIDVAWCFLSPFGYIKVTNLVGVGLTNNPFFGANPAHKVVAFDSPERSSFGNHAFVSRVADTAFDGCAGPHVGDETLFQYLSASIDDTPSLYPGRSRPGRVDDVVSADGIVRIA
jgi:hypothetical protein